MTKENCENVMEKIDAKFQNWKWLHPQMSYRGRVLILNNLVTAVAPTGLPESTIRPATTNSGQDGELFLGSAALGATVSVVFIHRGGGGRPSSTWPDEPL